MAGLHEFPYFETTERGLNNEELSKLALDKFKCSLNWTKDLPLVKHSFTRFRVLLKSKIFYTEQMVAPPASYKWVSVDELDRLAFSSGHRQVLVHVR